MSDNNMKIYEAARSCPEEALKPIAAGRLKGKSDINPMWRIKKLTEIYGPCGTGWSYEITKQWLEPGANGEIAAFCDIMLYVKNGDEWSRGIPGTGGSMFVASEKNGLYTSDECFKMALTDAISVACKALGFAADVYWNADRTKYDQTREPVQTQQSGAQRCSQCSAVITAQGKWTAEQIADMNFKRFGRVLCAACGSAENKKLKGETA